MYPRHLRPARCERSSEDGSDGSEDWQRGPATGSERIGSEEQQREEQQRVQHPEPKKYCEKADTNVRELSVQAAIVRGYSAMHGRNRRLGQNCSARARGPQSAQDERPRAQQGWLASGGRAYRWFRREVKG